MINNKRIENFTVLNVTPIVIGTTEACFNVTIELSN